MLVLGDPSTPLPLGILIPLIILILDLAVALYFIQDLYKPERRVYGDDKTMWLVIILFGSILGWMAYLLIGRQA
ncbi:MAG: hypothetical protein OJF49_000779 [Ktedonobacterales bacterium]|jgi:hypothetical protein|nr:MAG: hypothetical protein OJF49_000779 [Ktedonobacterales bacterium]